jgi:hypothetical protein
MIACKLERTATNLRQAARVPVPAGLNELLARCLSRRPLERPASATELRRAWRALGPAVVVPNPTPMLSFTPMAMTGMTNATETALTAAPLTKMGGRATRVGLIVAAGALVASSAVLVFALRARGGTAAAAPAQPSTDTVAAQPVDTSPASPNVGSIAAAPPATGGAAASPDPAPAAAASASASAAAPDAGAPRARPKPPRSAGGGAPRRSGSGSGGSAPPSGGPQIATEPRY